MRRRVASKNKSGRGRQGKVNTKGSFVSSKLQLYRLLGTLNRWYQNKVLERESPALNLTLATNSFTLLYYVVF